MLAYFELKNKYMITKENAINRYLIWVQVLKNASFTSVDNFAFFSCIENFILICFYVIFMLYIFIELSSLNHFS